MFLCRYITETQNVAEKGTILTLSFRASSPILSASARAYAHPGNTLGSILPSTFPRRCLRCANQSYTSSNHEAIPAFSASRSRWSNAPCGSDHGSRAYISLANSNAVRTQPRRCRSLTEWDKIQFRRGIEHRNEPTRPAGGWRGRMAGSQRGQSRAGLSRW